MVHSLHLCPQIFSFILERRLTLCLDRFDSVQLQEHYLALTYLHINETLINI